MKTSSPRVLLPLPSCSAGARERVHVPAWPSCPELLAFVAGGAEFGGKQLEEGGDAGPCWVLVAVLGLPNFRKEQLLIPKDGTK